MSPNMSQMTLKNSLNFVKPFCLYSPALLALQSWGFSHMLYAIGNLELALALIYCYLTYPYLQVAQNLAILWCCYFSSCFSFLFF